MFTLQEYFEKNGQMDTYHNWRRRKKAVALLRAHGFVSVKMQKQGDYMARTWYGKPEEMPKLDTPDSLGLIPHSSTE